MGGNPVVSQGASVCLESVHFSSYVLLPFSSRQSFLKWVYASIPATLQSILHKATRRYNMFKCKLDLLAHPLMGSHYTYNTLQITLPPTLPLGWSPDVIFSRYMFFHSTPKCDKGCPPQSLFFPHSSSPISLSHYFLVVYFSHYAENSFRAGNMLLFMIISQASSTLSDRPSLITNYNIVVLFFF